MFMADANVMGNKRREGGGEEAALGITRSIGAWLCFFNLNLLALVVFLGSKPDKNTFSWWKKSLASSPRRVLLLLLPRPLAASHFS